MDVEVVGQSHSAVGVDHQTGHACRAACGSFGEEGVDTGGVVLCIDVGDGGRAMGGAGPKGVAFSAVMGQAHECGVISGLESVGSNHTSVGSFQQRVGCGSNAGFAECLGLAPLGFEIIAIFLQF